MKMLLNYIEYYISIYNDSLDINEKILIINSINTIYMIVVSSYIDVSDKYKDLIIKEYNEFIKDKHTLKKDIMNYFMRLNKERLMSDEDIKYLFEISNKIDKNCINYIKDSTDKSMLDYYVNDNLVYLNLFKYLIDKTIYDDKFSMSCSINLYKDNLLILNNKSIIDYIHEVTHIYTRNINCIYVETPSIMAELGIESYYRLGDKHNRIQNLNCIRNSLLNIVLLDKINYQKELEYFVGTIISLAFIYNNGNDFNTIINGINTISYYSNYSFKNMLNILNISENEIIKSFKNKEKILNR